MQAGPPSTPAASLFYHCLSHNMHEENYGHANIASACVRVTWIVLAKPSELHPLSLNVWGSHTPQGISICQNNKIQF